MDWFMWLFVGLSVVFTIVPAILYFNDEEEQAIHLVIGWWGGVLTIAVVTVVMMFVVKPILNWGFALIF